MFISPFYGSAYFTKRFFKSMVRTALDAECTVKGKIYLQLIQLRPESIHLFLKPIGDRM